MKKALTHKNNLEISKKITYINCYDKLASKKLISELAEIFSAIAENIPIIVLCIGTDRVTGDSLGPLIGYKLKNMTRKRIHIYGNLEKPVHAKNIVNTIEEIYTNHQNPFVIAIDACLGASEKIGYLTIGRGSVLPGSAVNKTLPAVGDVYITGIVNYYNGCDNVILQNTRLSIVMRLADIVSEGIEESVKAYI